MNTLIEKNFSSSLYVYLSHPLPSSFFNIHWKTKRLCERGANGILYSGEKLAANKREVNAENTLAALDI